MKFVRDVIAVGDCIAVSSFDTSRSPGGKPLTRSYAIVIYKGNKWQAHRLSFHLNKRRVPSRLGEDHENNKTMILHTCDNKWCIKPDHLYKGSASENTRDIWARNLEFRKNVTASYSVAAKKRWRNPEQRRLLAEKKLAWISIPENKKSVAEKTRLAWASGKFANRKPRGKLSQEHKDKIAAGIRAHFAAKRQESVPLRP